MTQEQDSEFLPLWQEVAARPVDPETVHVLRDISQALAKHANVDESVQSSIGTEKSSRIVLRECVSKLKGADAVGKKAGFGIGSYQLKNWGRWLGGVGALTTAIIIAFVGIRYIPARATNQTKTYSTTSGQRATVTLSNGTTATLGPATILKVSNGTVELNGQAMFSVTHSSADPFAVRAGNTTVRVLGTTFGVRKYDSDREVRIAVAEGKVMVQQSVLSSGDIATSNNGQVNVTHDAELAVDWLAFAHGKLSINWQKLSDAAPELSRWLNMDIRIDSSVADRRFTTALQYESPNSALDEIAELTKTRYVRNGHVVTFMNR